jgi:hypothetical protein
MGVIGKLFAVIMFPLSILIIAELLGLFSVNLFFDKILIGASLMILLQLLTLLFLRINVGTLKPMQILTASIFMAISAMALCSPYIDVPFKEQIPLILGVVMFVETIYSLH